MLATLKEFFGSKRGKRILFRAVVLFNLLLVAIAISSLTVAAFAQEQTTAFQGDKFIGAGIAVAGSTLGAGIAISGTASSGMAALVEKSELSTWLLLLAGLGEGVAIYGLIIAILILGG